MAVTLVSTTDTPEQMQQTAEMFDLELTPMQIEGQSDPETPETPAAEEAPQAETETVTETEPTQESEEENETEEEAATEEEPVTQTPPRDETGKFKAEIPKGVQKKIDKAVGKQREAERRAQEAEERSQALEARLSKLETAAKPVEAPKEVKPEPKPEPKPAPKLSDFEDPDDYSAALTAYMNDQFEERLKQATDKTKAETKSEIDQQAEAEARTIAMQERYEAAKADIPDLVEVMEGKDAPATKVQLSDPMLQAIGDFADDDEISDIHLYHFLATHPEDAERLFKATHHDPTKVGIQTLRKAERMAGRAIAEIASELKAAKKAGRPAKGAEPAPKEAPPPATPKTKKAISSAPPPIEPVKGTSPLPPKDVSSMSPTEYRTFVQSDKGKAWYMSQGATEAEWKRLVNVS